VNKLYSCLNTEQIQKLQTIERIKSFQPREIIIALGDRNRDIMVTNSGEVEIISTDIYGNEIIIGILSKGDIFGEMNFVIPLRRTATIRSKTFATITCYPYQELCQLLVQEHSLGTQLLKTINELQAQKMYETLKKYINS
jgi:CRP-like cAMP-binding protein